MEPLKNAKQSTAGTTRRQEEVDGLSGGWKCSRRGMGTMRRPGDTEEEEEGKKRVDHDTSA